MNDFLCHHGIKEFDESTSKSWKHVKVLINTLKSNSWPRVDVKCVYITQSGMLSNFVPEFPSRWQSASTIKILFKSHLIKSHVKVANLCSIWYAAYDIRNPIKWNQLIFILLFSKRSGFMTIMEQLLEWLPPWACTTVAAFRWWWTFPWNWYLEFLHDLPPFLNSCYQGCWKFGTWTVQYFTRVSGWSAIAWLSAAKSSPIYSICENKSCLDWFSCIFYLFDFYGLAFDKLKSIKLKTFPDSASNKL